MFRLKISAPKTVKPTDPFAQSDSQYPDGKCTT